MYYINHCSICTSGSLNDEYSRIRTAKAAQVRDACGKPSGSGRAQIRAINGDQAAQALVFRLGSMRECRRISASVDAPYWFRWLLAAPSGLIK